MGFLITLLLSLVFFALGLLRPRWAVYGLLGLFVLFDELGPGFTTFRGSFVFNANFVGVFGFRLIEVVTAAAWGAAAFLSQRGAVSRFPAPVQFGLAGAFAPQRTIFAILAVWVGVLMFSEYLVADKITVATWRLFVAGAMQFHLFVIAFRDEEDWKRLVKALLILMGLKAAWGLAWYAAGQGVDTFRGRLPFFWDSKQIEAFGLGVVILSGYLLNYASIEKKDRFLSAFMATLILCLLLVSVIGSIRRTVWVTTAVGVLMVMLVSKRSTALHYFVIVFVAAAAVGSVLLLPGLEKFRNHMELYVSSLNLLDSSAQTFGSNAAHFNNVQSYFKMLTERPDILALGLHGPSGVLYKEILLGQYSLEGFKLGMAHNGLLRSTLFFGVIGMLLFVSFFAFNLRNILRVLRQTPEHAVLKHVAVACGAYLILDFGASLLFVPPFYTASKGLYYTLLQSFVVGAVAWKTLSVARGAALGETRLTPSARSARLSAAWRG